jgi:hypothetical protein
MITYQKGREEMNMTDEKIYTGTYKAQPDQLEKKKDGTPSKSSLAVVDAMIKAMEEAAEKEEGDKKI